MPGRVKTQREVNFLFSSSSPLNQKEKDRLAKEIREGKVKVVKAKKGTK